MAINKIVKNSLGADAVDATKIADNAIETAQINADAVNATKIADGAISEEHLDTTAITGFGDLGSAVASTDQIVVYDQSSGTLKKISQTNFLNFPTVSSVSPTNVVSGDGTGNYTFVIAGTGFTGASANLINTSGTALAFDSVTVDSPTQITGVIAKSSLLNSGEPYDVKVTAGSGLSNTLENQINVDASPIFVTASGNLGSKLVGVAGSFAVNATDPDSAGNVTFEIQSGSLPPSYTITNTAAEGGTAIIAGTDGTTSSSTTFNFVLRAVDAASNTSSRAFSIISNIPVSESFTSSGTFSVPAGITSADVLVVAGGGGAGGTHAGGAGAGGLIFFPAYPLTASGTITVTVGCGGAGTSPFTGNVGQNSVFGSPGDPGLGSGGVLTSNGGGAGGGGNSGAAGNGGSGGGSGYGGSTNGTATQPTQPGNSGAYGFGNPGGNSGAGAPAFGTAGGGGAGAAGQSGNNGGAGAPDAPYAGDGGVGRAYTISDGTTSVYYAGGGGGASGNNDGAGTISAGGQGGGGPGVSSGNGTSGTANRGGGGGGTDNRTPYTGGTGGKGIVIVRY